MLGRSSLVGTEGVWKEIPTSLLNSLTRPMPRRIAAVLKLRDGTPNIHEFSILYIDIVGQCISISPRCAQSGLVLNLL